jgi:hypothetical protein
VIYMGVIMFFSTFLSLYMLHWQPWKYSVEPIREQICLSGPLVQVRREKKVRMTNVVFDNDRGIDRNHGFCEHSPCFFLYLFYKGLLKIFQTAHA